MNPRLEGRTVLVTGASKGLGRALARRLIDEGANCICLARPSEELAALQASQEERLLALACDVTDSEAVNLAFETAIGRFGRLDALINNAAVYYPFLLEKAADADVLSHFMTNVLAPAWCIRAAIPHLRKSRGQIISVSSESVRNPFPFLSVYAASKGALEILSAALREELREDGIRVTLLRSGAIASSAAPRPGEGFNRNPEITQAFYDTIIRSGHAAMAGTPASAEAMCDTMIALLTLPDDVNIDLIEARGAGGGLVTDHTR